VDRFASSGERVGAGLREAVSDGNGAVVGADVSEAVGTALPASGDGAVAGDGEAMDPADGVDDGDGLTGLAHATAPRRITTLVAITPVSLAVCAVMARGGRRGVCGSSRDILLTAAPVLHLPSAGATVGGFCLVAVPAPAPMGSDERANPGRADGPARPFGPWRRRPNA